MHILTTAALKILPIYRLKAFANLVVVWHRYPTLFDPQNPKNVVLHPNNKDFSKVKSLMASMPSIKELSRAKARHPLSGTPHPRMDYLLCLLFWGQLKRIVVLYFVLSRTV